MPLGLVLMLSASSAAVSTAEVASNPQMVGTAAITLGDRTGAEPALLSSAPAVNVGLFYHTGYAVKNLDAAMIQFTNGLGIEWEPVRTAIFPVRLEDGQVLSLTFQVAFSKQGPPYIELVHVEPQDQTHPWRANEHKSPAHFGYAVDNLAAASDALAAAGFPRIATVNVPGASATVFAYHEGPGGIIVELVDRPFVPGGVCDSPDSPFCPPTV